jgi:pimeloyl-ACP methyl ester carboxylesterase
MEIAFGSNLLDIACGFGASRFVASAYPCRVTGLDGPSWRFTALYRFSLVAPRDRPQLSLLGSRSTAPGKMISPLTPRGGGQTMVRYRTVTVDGHKVFYRDAGEPMHPALLLLHGFPSSSHMFRNLIPLLADRYHIVAPDLPGFGFSDAPDRAAFDYTFDNLARVIEGFVDQVGLERYAIYVFDYGAPVGFRLALARPERITAIISQNGNAYEEGLSAGWTPIRKYWQESTAANRDAIREFLTPETTRWQYVHGVSDETLVAPESYALDSALLARPGNDEIQLDLFLDYASNIALYPRFHGYFRTRQPPLLAVWGRNDPFFLPAGAEAFKRDIPGAVVRLFDTGHFALETHVKEIAAAIRDFVVPESATPRRARL